MKKLLSILSAVAISATASTTVVACSSNMYKSNPSNPNFKSVDHTYDTQITEASLIARAKSLIVDKEFGFSDNKTKEYSLDENSIGDIVNVKDKDLANSKISDRYGNFIDDSNIPSDYLKGTTGEDGGIINWGGKQIVDTIIDKLIAKLPQQLQDPIKSLLGDIKDKLGLNGSMQSVADTLKPLLQVITNLNSQLALQGIPYALSLIPDLSKDSILFGAVNKVLDSLITDDVKTSISNWIGGLADAADLSSLGNDTVSSLPAKISDAFNHLLHPDNKDNLKYFITFANLTSNYLSSFNHTDDIWQQMTNNENKHVNDLEIYKADDGKGFNIAPIINESVYYVGNGIDPDRILKFCRILFMKDEANLNEVGTLIANGPLQQLFDAANISEDPAAMLKEVLQNKPLTNDPVFGNEKPFDALFNGNWAKLGKYGESIASDTTMQRIFWNDKTVRPFEPDEKGNTVMNLRILLQNVPLYKLLMADSKVRQDSGSDFSDVSLQNNNGILPNYAGYYTQESIGDIANELAVTFRLNGTLSAEDMKYHYFDFNDLNTVVSELLNNLLPNVITDLGKKDASVEIGSLLGYEDNNNPNYVKKDSWMGKLLETLLPILKAPGIEKDPKYYRAGTLTGNLFDASDALQFFCGGLSTFVTNALKGTDYDYWFNRVLGTNYDNVNTDGSDPTSKSVWYYGSLDRPVWSDFKKYGFDVTYFNDDPSVIKTMTLTIKFNLANVPTLINMLPAKEGTKAKTYQFTISKENINDNLSFKDIKLV